MGKSIVEKPSFWLFLTKLLALLILIDKELETSEADRSTLPHVIPRWNRIRDHINSQPGSGSPSNSLWAARYKTQIDELHVMAYLINPQTIDDHDNQLFNVADWRQLASSFLEDQLGDEQGQLALLELVQFRDRTGPFSRASYIWKAASSVQNFWQLATAIAPALKPIAIRLAQTPANSVPSERAFSIQNLLLNKLRNRLSTKRVDKLQYIYINQRLF